MVVVMTNAFGNWTLALVEGLRAKPIGFISDEALADRLAVLLNRHGMIDVPDDALAESAAEFAEGEN